MKYPQMMLQASQIQWAMTSEAMVAVRSLLIGDHDVPPREAFHGSDMEAAETMLGARSPESVLTRIRGKVGSLSINGPIAPRADALAESSGVVSIDRLISEFKALELNSDISQILLVMDSPGGAVPGVSEFASLIAGSKKTVTTYVFGMAASATYWIASAADRIVSANTGVVGSIGIIGTFKISQNKERAETVEIISAQTPNKNTDPTTPKGRAILEGLLSSVADVFIDTVAENRGVSRETVMSDFGKGGPVVAAKALEAGMIDAVGTLEDLMGSFESSDGEGELAASASTELLDNNSKKPEKQITTPAAAGKRKGGKMTLEEFLAENPQAAAEFAKRISAAEKLGADSVQARIDKVKPFMGTSEDRAAYPAPIQALIPDALSSDIGVAALKGAVAVYDSIKADESVKKAQAESAADGETPPQTPASAKREDGMIETEADYQADIKASRAAEGLESK